MISVWQGSAVHEIQKIIECPLCLGLSQDSSSEWQSDPRFIFLEENPSTYAVLCALSEARLLLCCLFSRSKILKSDFQPFVTLFDRLMNAVECCKRENRVRYMLQSYLC